MMWIYDSTANGFVNVLCKIDDNKLLNARNLIRRYLMGFYRTDGFYDCAMCSVYFKVPTQDGLIRIQNEISEVEKREIELRKEHASSRSNSVNGDSLETSSSPEPSQSPNIVTYDSKDDFKKNKIIEPHPRPSFMAPVLTRAVSTPQLFQVSPVKKFSINTPHKGIMEKFIASRGKMIGNQQYTTTQNNFKKNLMMVRS